MTPPAERPEQHATRHSATPAFAPSFSRIGFGSALGPPSDEEDLAYVEALRRAIELGVNYVDTAINYRCQRSERAIGRLLGELPSADRTPIVVSTKGGYLPLESPPPESKREYRDYIKREYLDPGIVTAPDLVAGGHCMAPAFLRNQVERSIANLGIDAIDLYCIHNPEQQLDAVSRDEFDNRMHDAFAELERCVNDGLIRSYGCATWNGLRVAAGEQNHLSIESLISVAHDVAGDEHHLAAVQMPVNLAMMEGARSSTQLVNGRERTPLEAADELGIAMIAVAPLMQGRLARDLPAAVRETFPEANSDAECALRFVAMLPNIASIVVGMRNTAHVEENVKLLETLPRELMN
jgi:aryl-alcohol dehydrogenase-like predicted oxidoreductase